MKTNIYHYLRIFLGVFIIGYALNQFFHFFPAGYGEMPDGARDFIDATVAFLPLLYIFEIIIGLFLIFNKWTRFILIVLFPLSVSFLIFSFANAEFLETWPAFLVAGLNIILLVNERQKYMLLFD